MTSIAPQIVTALATVAGAAVAAMVALIISKRSSRDLQQLERLRSSSESASWLREQRLACYSDVINAAGEYQLELEKLREQILPFLTIIYPQNQKATEKSVGKEAQQALQPFEESLVRLEVALTQAGHRMEILGSAECVAAYRRVLILAGNMRYYPYIVSSSWKQILRAHEPWDADAVTFLEGEPERNLKGLADAIFTLADDIVELRKAMQNDLVHTDQRELQNL
jgi:gas vesicle protein